MADRFDIRPVDDSEWRRFAEATFLGFHEEPDDEEITWWRTVVRLDRTLAVFDGDRIVGTAESLLWTMTVPYASPVRCAAVTSVTVTPTHRRRGLLRAMMIRQLNDLHAAGEPTAALYASEAAIYPRFGYGIAATGFAVTVERDHAALRTTVDMANRVAYVDLEEATSRLPAIHDRALRDRPGVMSREPGMWRQATVFDAARMRQRFGPRQAVVVDDDRGYVLYRMKPDPDDDVPPGGTVRVEELMAADAEAEAVLWSYIFGLDLMRYMEAANRPPDDPLRFLLVDPAREVRRFSSNLYIRIVDVVQALTARGYAAADRMAIAVEDSVCDWNDGCWLLETHPDGASCRRSDHAPDLRMNVTELASVYLGGVTASWLGAAGLIEERTPGALRRADRLFSAPLPPWNTTMF